MTDSTNTAPIHSTGRGGQGNIGRDPNKYVDGGIVREGAAGESLDGEYSAGRGGAGNMVPSPRVGPEAGRRGSFDKIPDESLKHSKLNESYHTGRGGGGNVHHAEGTAEKHAHDHKHTDGSLIDKAKHKLHLDRPKSPAV